MTCAEFEDKASQLWDSWVLSSDTTDPEEWDKAFASYTEDMEDLRVEYGHPSGKPRQRP